MSYLEVLKTRGPVGMLGDHADRLAAAPDQEIEAIRRIIEANVPVMPHPHLRDGERVRITRGPLMDLEGILVRSNPQQDHVDGTRVEAA